MRKLALYARLAATALKKNIRIYLPYLLACTGTVMMFNLICTLREDPSIAAVRGGVEIQAILSLGCWVVAIFSAILLDYTNRVIVRQRKREFGLYNILGMEKRHIGCVMLFETLYTALISLSCGLIGATVFSKLLQMVLLKMLGGEIRLNIQINPGAALSTLALFAAIFILTLLINLAAVHRARPVELLKSASEGEREPRARGVLAALGVICLGAGYYLSLRTQDAYDALGLFFIAVLLVIAGTYLLFTAFSIVLLKGLRKNKKYYYKTNHFAAVSGMIYRMKRNAMGLASICILSTMVLVTVSTTLSLYIGLEDTLNRSYPRDVMIHMRLSDSTQDQRELARARVKELAAEYGVQVGNEQLYTCLSFVSPLAEDGATLDFETRSGVNATHLNLWRFFTLEEYERLGGEAQDLGAGQALIYSRKEKTYERLNIGGVELTLKKLESFPLGGEETLDTVEMGDTLFIVLRDMAALEAVDEIQRAAYGRNASSLEENYNFDLSGSEEAMLAYEDAARTYAQRESLCISSFDARHQAYYENYVSLYGAMFFLGIFLGFLFLMTTVTIMYYKQVSEGMDDRGRYAIMQKVGMTRAEVKSAIRAQVLTVFFLPLGAAAVHVAFAFPMIRLMLRAFGLFNAALFARCTLCCIGAFAAVYTIIYLLTARAYYRIVDGRSR